MITLPAKSGAVGSGNLFAISFPGRLGRNSFLVMKNKLPVPIAFTNNQPLLDSFTKAFNQAKQSEKE